jgi:hypothetical protein
VSDRDRGACFLPRKRIAERWENFRVSRVFKGLQDGKFPPWLPERRCDLGAEADSRLMAAAPRVLPAPMTRDSASTVCWVCRRRSWVGSRDPPHQAGRLQDCTTWFEFSERNFVYITAERNNPGFRRLHVEVRVPRLALRSASRDRVVDSWIARYARNCGLCSRWNFDRRRRIVIGSPFPCGDRSDCERKRRGTP